MSKFDKRFETWWEKTGLIVEEDEKDPIFQIKEMCYKAWLNGMVYNKYETGSIFSTTKSEEKRGYNQNNIE